jgi:DNA polymerase-3 subunit beta
VRLLADRELLVEALSRVCRVTGARLAVRVLAGIRLAADGGRLELAATDLELAVTTSLDADVEDAGVAVAPARTLLAVVQALDADVVELQTEDGVLAVRCGDSRFGLNLFAADDFPQPRAIEDPIRLDLETAVLVETVGRVLRVASTDLSRPVYTGVRITAAGSELTLTATDGYRLATARSALAAPVGEFDVLVPARALSEVVRLAAGSARVTVELAPNLIRFTVPGCELVARTLDGRPQDHERILAAAFEHRTGVPRATLLRAVDRASLLADRGSAVELSFRGDEIRVRARTAEVGEADERVVLPSGGPTMRIGFNARYLRDGLDLVQGDEVWFDMSDGLRPVVLHGATDDFAYLVAPLRLPD